MITEVYFTILSVLLILISVVLKLQIEDLYQYLG